jgi:hypothetical protein
MRYYVVALCTRGSPRALHRCLDIVAVVTMSCWLRLGRDVGEQPDGVLVVGS